MWGGPSIKVRSEILSRREFEESTLETLDALRGYAIRLTRGRGADDLVQETVLRAIRARDQYRRGTNFKAWIFKIMTNLFIDTYRRKDRAPQQVPLDSVFDLKADEAPEQIEEVLDESELRRLLPDEILRALDELHPAHRVTVLLRDLGGFSYKEIASILDCPIGTVMSRLHYARNELKKLLRAHAEEEGFLPEGENRGTHGDDAS